MKIRWFPVLVSILLIAPAAFADSVYLLGGYFSLKGNSDIYTQNEVETTFRTKDLNDFIFTAGYDHFLGEFISIGGSLSFYESDSTVRDLDFEFRDGRPVIRTIFLRIVPMEFNVRLLPAGRNASFIPYIGGGIGFYFWRYEEFGDFVTNRNTNPRIISGSAYSDGTDIGWHVEGGIQVPISRTLAIVGEVKYFDADGRLSPASFDPAFEPIDLSGTAFTGGVAFWF